MRSKHSVSFIIPAYNCADTLEQTVQSIYDGNFNSSDEIIIVDDKSSDNTPSLIRDLAAKFPNIISVRHSKNKGSAAAGRNTGIKLASNDLIFCLDADNLLHPNSIPQLVDLLDSTHADCAAFSELHFFKNHDTTVTHKWVFPEVITLALSINSPNNQPCSSGNYLFTKKFYDIVGGYDESIGGAYDSYLYGVRQLGHGAKFVTLPNSGYLHRYGTDSAFIRDEKKFSLSLLIS